MRRDMNHCVLEVEVREAPTIRYTQDNQTPIAEMTVTFDGLRQDDAPGELKVVGWGNLAQDLQNRVQVGQKLMLEGRLRMNTVPRQDGTKEKRAEFTLSRLHPIGGGSGGATTGTPAAGQRPPAKTPPAAPAAPETSSWNAAPLVPDTDEIPF